MTFAPSPEFTKAFVAAQAEITGVGKDAKNPHFKSRYATLEAVIDAARPILARHKLAFMQLPGGLTDQGLSVRTMVFHESGGGISHDFTVPLPKRDPQGAGSAITYACRYALMAALGMPPVDDDGEASMPRNTPSAPTSPARNAGGSSASSPNKQDEPPAPQLIATNPPAGVDKDLWETAVNRALGGVEAYREFWQGDTTSDERNELLPHHNALKAMAANAKKETA